jgi:Phage integrase family
VVIAPFALEALKQHRIRRLAAKLKAGALWQDHDYVFCTSIGTHLNPSEDVLDQLKGLLKKAGLPAIRFHDLRHSAATLLLTEGVHPKVVQELLGHSNISMTMDVYSHVLPSMQQDAISRLNTALGKTCRRWKERCASVSDLVPVNWVFPRKQKRLKPLLALLEWDYSHFFAVRWTHKIAVKYLSHAQPLSV